MPSDVLADAPPTLPLRLRDATRVLHAAAERAGAMAALLKGRLPHAGYRQMLAQLLALYQSLEAALDANARLPWLQGVDREALRRVPTLLADLSAPPSALSSAPLSGALLPVTQAYCARLHALGTAADPALLAHVYTRYLGDLHGGQILHDLVQRTYPQQGCRFYEFGDTDRVQALRSGLRQALAAAPLSHADAERVLDEACWSFEQHRRLFEALAPA